ncbi:hypothetical protein QBE52_00305 [Clostridiaceae bacterium 35-E11]
MEDFLIEVIDKCSVEDLMRGYVYDINSKAFICLFCGEIYEDGIIYKKEEKMYTAEKATQAHIKEAHNGSFNFLLNLDKKYTGVSERQKEIFKIFYDNSDNQEAAKKLETKPSTIRSYKFKNHEKLRQAKVFLALGSLLEKKNEKKDNVKTEIADVAAYKKIKKMEKSLKENEQSSEEDKRFRSLDLNFINPFIKKGNPRIK